jgi:hypothetical protein
MKRAALGKIGSAFLLSYLVLRTLPAAAAQDEGLLRNRVEKLPLPTVVLVSEESREEVSQKDFTYDQVDRRSDLRFQPYIYAGPAKFTSYGGSAFEFGGGMDWLVHGGLGLGFDASILGDGASAVASGSLNVSYHFIPQSPGLVPFVVAGIGGAGAPEYGLDGWTWVNFGGGVNYWLGNGMAFRVEVRGRFEPEYGDNVVGLRMGVTF